jgi:hypothetical protein
MNRLIANGLKVSAFTGGVLLAEQVQAQGVEGVGRKVDHVSGNILRACKEEAASLEDSFCDVMEQVITGAAVQCSKVAAALTTPSCPYYYTYHHHHQSSSSAYPTTATVMHPYSMMYNPRQAIACGNSGGSSVNMSNDLKRLDTNLRRAAADEAAAIEEKKRRQQQQQLQRLLQQEEEMKGIKKGLYKKEGRGAEEQQQQQGVMSKSSSSLRLYAATLNAQEKYQTRSSSSTYNAHTDVCQLYNDMTLRVDVENLFHDGLEKQQKQQKKMTSNNNNNNNNKMIEETFFKTSYQNYRMRQQQQELASATSSSVSTSPFDNLPLHKYVLYSL